MTRQVRPQLPEPMILQMPAFFSRGFKLPRSTECVVAGAEEYFADLKPLHTIALRGQGHIKCNSPCERSQKENEQRACRAEQTWK